MYEFDFLTDARLSEFYAMLTGLLKSISPFLMIAVSIILAGWLMALVIKTVRKALGKEKHSDYEPSESREERKYKY